MEVLKDAIKRFLELKDLHIKKKFVLLKHGRN